MYYLSSFNKPNDKITWTNLVVLIILLLGMIYCLNKSESPFTTLLILGIH